jgi:hypothetical protein
VRPLLGLMMLLRLSLMELAWVRCVRLRLTGGE